MKDKIEYQRQMIAAAWNIVEMLEKIGNESDKIDSAVLDHRDINTVHFIETEVRTMHSRMCDFIARINKEMDQ